jgi:two-component system phosphate regulon sensor histidine kinase PhoR
LAQRYAELFELAPVGYVITDPAGVVLEANKAAGELFARDVESVVGRRLAELVGPERRSAFDALVEEAAAGGRWHDEVPFVLPDGARARLLVNALGPPPGSEQRIRWSMAASSSSLGYSAEREDLAEAQRVQRQRLSSLLDRLQHGVLAVDGALRISYANAAATKLLGNGAAVAGRALADLWTERSLQELVAAVFEPRAEPAEAQIALEKERRSYDVLALPPDVSGEALLVVADVTVNERRRRAEREFVANAAHQLRTPVSAIASAIEVLQSGAKENPEARDRFLAHLDRQCTRLVRLTRALLLLARAQALDELPAVEVVPLRPLLDAVAAGIRPGQGVEVRVECAAALASLANRDLLEQAIGNLAENAAKYTVEGEIVLCAEPADGQVRVVVSDTGPGADLPTDGSFQRFYGDPAAQGEGFGLGLAIAAEAVRALRGELEIESGERGTRVVVTVPSAVVRQS